MLIIQGKQATRAKNILSSLIEDIKEKIIDNEDVENAIRLSTIDDNEIKKVIINTPKKKGYCQKFSSSKLCEVSKRKYNDFRSRSCRNRKNLTWQ